MRSKFKRENLVVANAIDDRIREAFEGENGTNYMVRSVVIIEYFSGDREFPSVAYLSFGRDGDGINRWEVMGLVKAAQLMMEYDYTHDE